MFSADELENGARAATGLDDFGSPYYREGLERTVESLNTEAELSEMGAVIQHAHDQQRPNPTPQGRGHLCPAPRNRQ